MSVEADHASLLQRDELTVRNGIYHRADETEASAYRQRWEDEAADDPVRSAIAADGHGAVGYEQLTAKVSPVWDRIPRGRGLGSVLEIGAGYGRIPLYLARERQVTWTKYCAVDISETMLARLVEYREQFAPSQSPLYPICTSADELPLEQDSVDVVLTSAVFLHMGKSFVGRAVRELSRTLKPGGHFVFDVSFPNARNPSNLLPQLKPHRLRPPNYMKYWTRAEIETLLAESGLAAKAARFTIEPGSHALLPKRLGPVPIPLARRANRLAERAPASLQGLVTSSYTVLTPELFA
jgi:SAM-dependent methyltransferase